MKRIIFMLIVIGGFSTWYLNRNNAEEPLDDSEISEEINYDNEDVDKIDVAEEDLGGTSSIEETAEQEKTSKPLLKDKAEKEKKEENDESTAQNKAVTEAARKEFQAATMPSTLPDSVEGRYGITRDLYLKSSFYLNEVAAGHIKPTRENLKKAFQFILLHENENNVEDISDVLRMISDEQSKSFAGALKLLDEQEEGRLQSIIEQDPEELEEQ